MGKSGQVSRAGGRVKAVGVAELGAAGGQEWFEGCWSPGCGGGGLGSMLLGAEE